MKIINTEAEIQQVRIALNAINARLFMQESGDPKRNAQRNLCGRTHYVDDETLRWHKSRVTGGHHEAGGLVFSLSTSDALDSNGTKRGFRVATFDVFGACLSRPKLEDASPSSAAARKFDDTIELDLLKHYREALTAQWTNKQEEVKNLNDALAGLGV